MPANPGKSGFRVSAEDLGGLFEDRDTAQLGHFGGAEGLCEALQVDANNGLPQNPRDAPERVAAFGANSLPDPEPFSFLRLVWLASQDRTLLILSGAAIISLILGLYQDFGPSEDGEDEPRIHWIEGTAILATVLVVILAESLNDYNKEKQFRKLNAKKEERDIVVIRQGDHRSMSVHDLLVGDIALLEPGDIAPADGILLEQSNLRMDESTATGESEVVRKTLEDDPFILSGTSVAEGTGRMIVCCVGQNSFYGRTLMAMKEEPEDPRTPLEIKLDDLAERIAKLGAAAAFLMFCAVIAKYVITTITSGRGFGEDCATQECPSRVISALLETFISAIAVVVVAVPEGLPLAVTLALAYGTTRMLKDHNLVRVLSACETMGGVTAVLTDKTGTLTENKMTVVRGMLGCDMPFRKQDEKDEAEVEAPEQEHKTRKSIEDLAQALAQGGDNGPPKPCLDPPTSLQTLLALFQESVAINSSAFSRSDPNNPGQHQLVGSRTESALLQLVEALGGPSGDWEGLRRMDSMEVLHTYPFSSAQKAMATIVRIKTNEEPRYRVHVKGAGEILLEKCDQAPCLEAGQVVQLHPEIKERLGREIEGMAESTLRTLCIAYRDLSEQEFRDISADKGADGQSEPSLETLLNTDGLVLLAIVGIEDPIREGVARAIAKCQKAGVRIIMCTGDNEKTARSIADRCGILGEDGMSMQGVDFRKRLENGDLDQGSLAKLQVLSRSSPTDKQGLVRRLQELGETVAVTGDGTNDAPALKLADIGLSMGKSGTEVAKEASEIVLMEDRFEDCVKAIMWGRAIGDAVRKFLQFQLTVNLTATVLAFTSSLADGNQQSVLTAVQMLWINFAMDSLAGLALATEEPTEDILDRPPQGKDSALISPGMWKMIAGESVLQIAVTLTLLFAGPTMFGLENLAYAGGITRDLDTVEAPPDFAGSPADFSALCWNEKTKLRSIVFNTFVFLQLFNELNCRRLGRKLNVFANLTRSMSFVWVMALVVPIQICIMFFGGTVFRIAPLLPTEWAVSVGLGLLALPVGLMVRLLPLDGMFEGKIVLAREEHEPIHEPEEPEAPSVRVTIGPWPGQFPPTPNSEGASVSRSGTPMSAASSMATSASSASRLKWYKILRGGRLHAADLVSIASSGGPRRRTRRDLFYRTPARARWEMLQDAVVRRKWSVSDATSGERERLIPIDGANQGTSTTSEPSTSAN